MQASSLNALLDSADCLVSAEEMNAAYARLAHDIERDWSSTIEDHVPLVLVVMSGGLVAAGKGGGQQPVRVTQQRNHAKGVRVGLVQRGQLLTRDGVRFAAMPLRRE